MNQISCSAACDYEVHASNSNFICDVRKFAGCSNEFAGRALIFINWISKFEFLNFNGFFKFKF